MEAFFILKRIGNQKKNIEIRREIGIKKIPRVFLWQEKW